MTVKQLIRILRKLPKYYQDASVYVFDGEFGKVGLGRIRKYRRKWPDKSVSKGIVLL